MRVLICLYGRLLTTILLCHAVLNGQICKVVLTDNERHHNNTLCYKHYNDMDLKLRNPTNMFITVYKQISYRFNYVLILFINHEHPLVTVIGSYYTCSWYLHDQSVEVHTSRILHGTSEILAIAVRGRIRGGIFGIRQKPSKSSLTFETDKLATILYPRASRGLII